MNQNHVIFVIDDSAIISELLVHVLTRELNARVLAFESCESALSALEKVTPDLILLDYHLNSWEHSNMSGKEFLEEMQKRHHTSAVIVISGQNDKTISVDMLQLGAIDYISKGNETFIEEILEATKETLSYLDLKKKEQTLSRQVPGHLKRGGLLLLAMLILAAVIWWIS